MLTTAQRRQCVEIAAALDAGNLAVWRKARPSLSPEMKGEVWDQRAHVKAQAARTAKAAEVLARSGPKASTTARIEIEVPDLDFWADDAPVEPDDDDDGQPCAVCDGTGRDAQGGVCQSCGGTGRVVADQDDEDDDHELEEE